MKNADHHFIRNETVAAIGGFTSAAPTTFLEHYHEISKLYPTLNIFEQLWQTWYAYMNNDVLATGVMSFAMHEIVYFGRSLLWMIIDASGIFRKYKIQAVSQ